MAKIGLDIGHGRNTFPPSKGVYKNGAGHHEYDANSRVAKQLEKKLKVAGHTVVMAQPYNANDVALITRTNRYIAEKVDLIMSLHANAGGAAASGYAAFYRQGDARAKHLSDLYEAELVAQGFKLWGGSRPSMPTGWSNFHMCRVPSQNGIPSILLENGFMTNAGDFEWIFGDKKDEYAEKCATAAFNAAQNFLGEKPESVNSQPVNKPASTPSTGKAKTDAQLADEVIAGKHGSVMLVKIH
ncbi:N-acetylmuramoyl-L-alanine amidase [Bacillus sp. JCM 19041]|uniref:N-acetylmuramoyl-L-alanine amidase n=1 Tax=Bacillus sp. JCM 19041 TaxID=1460637 RepID=UPI0006D1DABB